ncbi:unnamed protein product [Pylaiella littoralis]
MIRTAAARLEHERKNWRRDPDRPIGMWMRLADNEEDGSQSIFKWECGIPGPEGTNWEGGEYRIRMDFPQDYPFKPPRCKFVPPLFHPNVYPSGTICLRLDAHRHLQRHAARDFGAPGQPGYKQPRSNRGLPLDCARPGGLRPESAHGGEEQASCKEGCLRIWRQECLTGIILERSAAGVW